jgi:eukaryotic-like serine/threonine-protein kinase
MDPQKWQRLKAIVADALEENSPSARIALVERSCADDTTLLRHAESLLGEAEQLLCDPTDELEECAEHVTVALGRDDVTQIGRRLGAYVFLRELGRGGMGAVYLAARADGCFEKEVAVKLLKRGTDTDEVLRRFRAERQVLARLDHPNIARLLDAGTTEDGLPYFVMEYIDGIPVTRFVSAERLSVAERLELFLKICAAVEVAHRNRVVHRDLKANNILVNGDGEPKLLDFGIAKLLPADEETLELTALGQQRLTPICASPEQARGEPVTTASDIYALGALLYELLSSEQPHHFSTRHPSPEELVRVLGEETPTPPSLATSDRATERQLRGDLDNIVLFALRKEPARRYSSVAEFAEDIRRYLAGLPVHARPNTVTYRAQRFFRRNKGPGLRLALATAGLLLVAALIISLTSLWSPKLQSLSGLNSPSDKNFRGLIPEKSIAVLPFDSFTHDPENGYFVDGVQDNILTDLAKVSDLKVIGRTSVAQYRGVAKNVRRIGQTLGVAHVLEGSVQKSGDRIRVNAQLIDTRTETQIWAEHYDRKVDDLFVLQSELAQTIVSQLKATLSATEKVAIETKPTQDMQAYDLYLRAKELFLQSNQRQAIELLESSIKRDPAFTQAYCLLAESQLYLYRFSGDQTRERLMKAKAAAQEALRLAPALPDSHLAQAQYYYYGLRDYQRARSELALTASSPTDPAKFFDLAALTERRLGRWKDAVRDGEKAAELDPHNPFVANEVIQTYNALRRYADAERFADKAIEVIAPKEMCTLWLLKSESILATGRTALAWKTLEGASSAKGRKFAGLGRIALYERDYPRALELFQRMGRDEVDAHSSLLMEGVTARAQGNVERARKAFEAAQALLEVKLREQPDDAGLLIDSGLADAGLGRKESALSKSRRAVDLMPVWHDAIEGPICASMLAQVYAWTGETDAALEELAIVVKLPSGPSYGELHLDPAWDDLRGSARFDELVAESTLPPVIAE